MTADPCIVTTCQRRDVTGSPPLCQGHQLLLLRSGTALQHVREWAQALSDVEATRHPLVRPRLEWAGTTAVEGGWIPRYAEHVEDVPEDGEGMNGVHMGPNP
jgi:hypothetical protein